MAELFFYVSFILGAIFLGIVLGIAYLGGLISGVLILYRAGHPLLAILYTLGLIGATYYTMFQGYNVLQNDWEMYRFQMTIIGVPLTFVVGLIISFILMGFIFSRKKS